MKTAMRFALASVVALAMVGTVASTAPAFAASRGHVVSATGACSGSSTWTLTLKLDNKKVESDFEVHTGTRGQTWAAVMTDNGTQFYSKSKVTKKGGDVSFQKKTKNQPGTDNIVATATNQTTAEVCQGSGSI